MRWTGPSEATPSTRIAALGPALQPSERRVAEAIASDPAWAVESTAQEVAERVGVGRATVVRSCQTLGYDGYPQLRVALARELSFAAPPRDDADASALGRVRGAVEAFAASLAQATSLLRDDAVEGAVAALVDARRVLVAANGLSGPLAADASMRLTAAGRPAEFVQDQVAQQIAAAHLGEGSVCLVISGSGANGPSLAVADRARAAGATVVAITSFPQSPLVGRAHLALVVPPQGGTFRDELEHTSRAAHALLIEALVEVVASRLGARGKDARATVYSILSDSLGE